MKARAIVLVKKLVKTGKCKLANKWEKEPYIVVKQSNSDIQVYVLRSEFRHNVKKTLHRNLLLPIFSLPVEELRKNYGRLDQREDTNIVNTNSRVESKTDSVNFPEKLDDSDLDQENVYVIPKTRVEASGIFPRNRLDPSAPVFHSSYIK